MKQYVRIYSAEHMRRPTDIFHVLINSRRNRIKGVLRQRLIRLRFSRVHWLRLSQEFKFLFIWSKRAFRTVLYRPIKTTFGNVRSYLSYMFDCMFLDGWEALVDVCRPCYINTMLPWRWKLHGKYCHMCFKIVTKLTYFCVNLQLTLSVTLYLGSEIKRRPLLRFWKEKVCAWC